MEREHGLGTHLAHAGSISFAKKVAKSVSVPKVPPIYMTSVFSFDDVPTLDEVYAGTSSGYVYTRMANPSYDCLSELMAHAEGCDNALVSASGMGAIITSIIANVKAGDHILASPVLYGAVYDYLKNEVTRFGVEVDFADFVNDDIEKHIKPNTKVLYTETITNPLMEVMDIKKIADVAHKHGAKLIVDNTFATPAVCRPLEPGADVSVYSATKYLGGHSDITSGIVCGNAATIDHIKRYSILYGATPSPFDAWLLTRSLRTLELRVRAHSENAIKVAEYFEKHPKAEKVFYPGLKNSPFNAVAMKQFTNGWCGGMLSVDIAGGEAGASAFIKHCENVKFVPSLAGYATTISYPAKTSHRAYSPEKLTEAGISMGTLRFSIGLERIEDVIEEFDRAFKNV
ncbi:MAG: aminotransferase class I/II-fold pyridoxal phosphate-dependent enzyme [Defluviitaleaceae bacterium]|nr:aminotransferase class I/II-fold pyridoxal phosphate-dependent enzyme [Defluviitaleaceae bacterium]